MCRRFHRYLTFEEYLYVLVTIIEIIQEVHDGRKQIKIILLILEFVFVFK